MSRILVDENLLSWEAYASGGKFGLPDDPKIIFNCLSDPAHRPRFAMHDGHNADAEQAVMSMPEEELREMLRTSRALD